MRVMIRGLMIPLVLVLLGFSTATAQIGEFGISIGTSNFIGDLGKKETDGKTFFSDIQASVFRPAFGAFYRATFNPFFSLRASLVYGRLYGDDRFAEYNEIMDNAWFRNYRNLHFKSHVLELAVIGELHLMKYQPGSMYHRFAPYLFGGIALINFDPRTEYKGEWIRLRPLGTEGQGLPGGPKKYSLIQPAIPLGFGVKYNINRDWAINIEVGHRFAFTDYIDDVSTDYVSKDAFFNHYGPEQGNFVYNLSRRSPENDPEGLYRNVTAPGEMRGSPEGNDGYFMMFATLTYRFTGNKQDVRNPFAKKRLHSKYRKAFRRK